MPYHIEPRIVKPDEQIKSKAVMAAVHDSKRGIRPLIALQPGTSVVLQDGYYDPRKRWRVVEQYGRQLALTDGCRIVLRNRQHVREECPPTCEEVEQNESISTPPHSSESITTPLQSSVSPPVEQLREETGSNCSTEGLPQPGSVAVPDSFDNVQTAPTSQCAENNLQINTPRNENNLQVVMPRNNIGSKSLFRENCVTRSGRTVKLSFKAREANESN